MPARSQAQSAALARVRHYSADFRHLDELFPGQYPRIFVRGEGTDLIDEDGHRVLDAGNHHGDIRRDHGHRHSCVP